MFRYDNPALDAARFVTGPLAVATYSTVKNLYDVYTSTEAKNVVEAIEQYPMKTTQTSLKRRRPSSGYRKPPKKKTHLQSFQTQGQYKEKHWVDVSAATLNVTNTVSTFLLNGIVTGADYYQRIGHNIVMKSLNVNIQIYPKSTLAGSTLLAWAIVYDRQTNGTTPSWSDVFNSTNSAGAFTSGYSSHFNRENSDRFLVLRHRIVTLPSITVTAGVITNLGLVDPTQPQNYNEHIKLDLPTRYDADTSAVTDIVSGGLWIIAISNSATNSYDLTFSSRLNFMLPSK